MSNTPLISPAHEPEAVTPPDMADALYADVETGLSLYRLLMKKLDERVGALEGVAPPAEEAKPGGKAPADPDFILLFGQKDSASAAFCMITATMMKLHAFLKGEAAAAPVSEATPISGEDIAIMRRYLERMDA